MRRLFGTDGVRDIANQGLMTPEMALRLGRAYVEYLIENGIARPKIVVGRDTRRSGMMLESALAAGMSSAGADVLLLGIIPTPGVSFAVQNLASEGGAVISASHNPAEYNGIKFLDGQGFKLSDEAELRIEEIFSQLSPVREAGVIGAVPNMVESYAKRIASLAEFGVGESVPRGLVFDCAHGAACAVMPLVLEEMHADYPLIGANSDGLNINERVGVMHLNHLAQYMQNNKCKLGIAFDGDADRVLFVDKHGRLIDGDIMLWIMGRWLAARGALGAGVVATVMSNGALEEHLSKDGITVFRCPVGDRYVLEKMRECFAHLGGEQSGHIITFPYANTGDGLCTAFLFLKACSALDEDIDTLVDRFGPHPQVLKNIRLKKGIFVAREAIAEATSEAETRLCGAGRVLIRPSGTEPLLRILVEAKERALMEETSIYLLKIFNRYAE